MGACFALLVSVNALPGCDWFGPKPTPGIAATTLPTDSPGSGTTETPVVPTPAGPNGNLSVNLTLISKNYGVETLNVTGKPSAVGVDRAKGPGQSDRIWILREDDNLLTVMDALGKNLGNYDMDLKPVGITMGGGGKAWIYHGGGRSLFQVDAFGDIASSFVNLPASADVAIGTDGSLWMTNPATDKIWHVGSSSQGTESQIVGKYPAAISVDRDGRTWVVNREANTLVRLSVDGLTAELTLQVGSGPEDLAVDQDNNIWIASSPIQKWTPAGIKLQDLPGYRPTSVAIGPDGSAWFAEREADRVVHIGRDGGDVWVVPVGKQPAGLDIDSLGTVWVANSGSDTVTRLLKGKANAAQ